jgi:hypothetical protein
MYSRSGPSKAYRKVRNPRHGQNAVGDRCLVPPPFSIHAVYRGVRLCENHVRMPIGFDALDHEDMPVVVPGPDPCALKAGNVGRHIWLRHLHVKLVRQRNDGLRIDSCRLGLSVVHPTHGYHHITISKLCMFHPRPSRNPAPRSPRGGRHIEIMHYKEASLVRQCALPVISGTSWQSRIALPRREAIRVLRCRDVGVTSAMSPLRRADFPGECPLIEED